MSDRERIIYGPPIVGTTLPPGAVVELTVKHGGEALETRLPLPRAGQVGVWVVMDEAASARLGLLPPAEPEGA